MKVITDSDANKITEIYSQFGKVSGVGLGVSDGKTLLAGNKRTIVVYFEKLFKRTKIEKIPLTYKRWPVCYEVIGKISLE